jgi:hypothetical protein
MKRQQIPRDQTRCGFYIKLVQSRFAWVWIKSLLKFLNNCYTNLAWNNHDYQII